MKSQQNSFCLQINNFQKPHFIGKFDRHNRQIRKMKTKKAFVKSNKFDFDTLFLPYLCYIIGKWHLWLKYSRKAMQKGRQGCLLSIAGIQLQILYIF